MKTAFITFLSLLFTLQIVGQKKNEAIIKYTTEHLGKKIDRGECWDLPAFALDAVNADWQKPYDFGTIINPKKQKLMAGDIMSFKNVKFASKDGALIFFPEHYAIVYKVIDKNHIQIAHQNHNGVRSIGLLDLNLNEQKKGKVVFYRAR